MASEEAVLGEARKAMQRSLESLQRDMARIRTGRANPALLDVVSVDYYGTPTPLKQLATLSAPEPRLLVVQPFDPSALAAMEKAILKADLGLTPVNDGKILRVPIPELTEERRRELVKQIKKLAEDHKLGVRSARRDALALVKAEQKGGDFTEDDVRRIQKWMQDLTDEFGKRIDEAVAAKEQEILQV
jgi:ribosome recycling factor